MNRLQRTASNLRSLALASNVDDSSKPAPVADPATPPAAPAQPPTPPPTDKPAAPAAPATPEAPEKPAETAAETAADRIMAWVAQETADKS